MKNIKCPSCKKVVETKRGWGYTCPHCGEKILLRNKIYVSQEEAAIIDWITRLHNSLGLTKEKFEIERQELSKQFGFKASVNDTIWRFLNKSILTNDYFQRKISYFEMGRLALTEGKETKPYITEALKTILYDYRQKGFSRVRIFGCGNRCDDSFSCNSCKSLCGEIISIDKALDTMPIPNICTNQICRCTYEILEEDVNKIFLNLSRF